jgi:hypothetical protein
MSELIPIWNHQQLTGATTPPPFVIPNNPNAKTIKINNQSRYWLILTKTQSNIDVDRIEPFSFLIFPFEADLSLRIDTSGNQESSLSPDKEFVDYSVINGFITYQKGSTQFNGAASVSIAGNVNIGNSQLDVAIQGTPTVNLANNTVQITGTPTFNIGSMPNVTIANATLKVQLDQSGGNNTVNIAGTPSVNIANSSLNVSLTGTNTVNLAAGTTVAISGTPTMNIASMPNVTIANATLKVQLDQTGGNNTVNIAGTPSVNIANSSLNVTLTGTNTVNLAAGSTVSITGTPTMNIGSMPNVTIANATLKVQLDQTGGNNTVNIAGTPSVNIANSSLNVAIQGTPTFNLGAGASVSIAGTPTMNIGSMPNVTIANSSLNVSLTGTNTVNIGSMPNVNIAGGSVTVTSGNTTVVNQQLPVGFIYNAKATFVVPAGTNGTNYALFNYQFLSNGTMANVHHVDFYIHSNGGISYAVQAANGYTTFADGTTWNTNSNWTITANGVNSYSADGQASICNDIQFQIISPAQTLSSPDTITVYFAIDTNETAIGTIDGVPIKPYSDSIKDASGTITTANTVQQVLGWSPKRYIFFQNLSSSVMYIGLGNTILPGNGTAGSILIPPYGGSYTVDGTYCSADLLFVYCQTAGAAFTCKYY